LNQMYFTLIYDHKFMQSDRDFYADSIISFYPNELKENYIYLLGQIIGSIEFFKGFINSSNLSTFKLDKIIIAIKSFNQQFSLVI
jgi:hypothetical protein